MLPPDGRETNAEEPSIAATAAAAAVAAAAVAAAADVRNNEARS